jgi:hypothetical protein
MTLSDLLTALDAIAPQKASSEEVGDAHIAAFIASHLNLTREIKLSELRLLPEFAMHHGLIMLKLLSQAQSKSDEDSLKGLSHWIAARLLPLLGNMHSRVRKLRLQTDLRATAARGSLPAIAALLLSPQAFEADTRDFEAAMANYASLNERIKALKSNAGLPFYASMQGRGFGQSVAYCVCLATVYFTIKSCFHL